MDGLSHRQGTLIVDEDGKLAGIITRGDLVRALEKSPEGSTVVEAGTQNLIIAFPDEFFMTPSREWCVTTSAACPSCVEIIHKCSLVI